MPTPKDVVEPAQAVEKTPAPTTAAPTPTKVVVFWKKISPFEKITFKDGSTFVFGRQTFATADQVLANKIKQVADQYGIFVQKD